MSLKLVLRFFYLERNMMVFLPVFRSRSKRSGGSTEVVFFRSSLDM